MPTKRRKKKRSVSFGKGLRSSLTVLVPSTTAKAKKISRKQFTARIKGTQNYLNRQFGGTTKVSAQGSYTLKSGRLIKERVAKVTAFASPKAIRLKRSKILKHLSNKKKVWGQESLAVELETPKKPSRTLHFL